MRPLIALLLLAAAASLPSAASARTRIPLEPLPGAHVGRVAGTRAFVAVSLHHGKLRVYVCDATLRRDPSISTWFRHRWHGRKALTLRSHRHTLRIDVVGADGTISGRLDGTHAFRTRPADAPAGLFKGQRRGLRATWIVLPGLGKRGTFIPTRPRKCRFVLVTGPNGSQQWVSVC
jgi:hypothetical protein